MSDEIKLMEEDLQIQLMDYEKQIFLDAFHDDGLLIMARGLGVERIFASFLKLYSDPANLVLVINTNMKEEEYFVEKLENEECTTMPKSSIKYSNNHNNVITFRVPK